VYIPKKRYTSESKTMSMLISLFQKGIIYVPIITVIFARECILTNTCIVTVV